MAWLHAGVSARRENAPEWSLGQALLRRGWGRAEDALVLAKRARVECRTLPRFKLSPVHESSGRNGVSSMVIMLWHAVS